MKKLVLLTMIVCMAIPCLGASPFNIWARPDADWLTGQTPNFDPAWAWMKWADNQITGAMAGTALFVDSANGSDTNKGTSWNYAYSTIQKAVTNVEDYGVIFVAGGAYAETVTTVVGIENVKLIGVSGSKQIPHWTNATPADTATWHLRINGAGWTVSGFRFHHAAASEAPAIVIDGDNSASGCLIANNNFTSSGGAPASGGIVMWWYAFDHRIIGNEFFNLTDAGAMAGCIYTTGRLGAGNAGSWAVGLVIEDNIFYHNEACISVCGSFMQIRGNTFSGMEQDDDQHTDIYVDLVHPLGAGSAFGDGDYTSIGSNIIVDNYFCDHFSWEIIAANGYLFNDTDSIAGNFCKDGVMGRGGPSTAQADVSDAQLVPGRTYSLVKTDGIAGDDDLFLISGGAISITSLVGYITEDIGIACTMTIELDHADQDFEFTDAVDIQSGVDGGRIVFTNANVSTLTLLALGNDIGSTSLMMPWFSPAGMIESDSSDADTTGTIRWYMTFIPLEPGVSVTVK